MTRTIGLVTGSFDPVTLGHIDLIERASQLVDQLYVGVFYNQNKTGFLTIDKRKEFLIASLKHIENIQIITSSNSLAVEVAQELEVTHFIRGLRDSKDLSYEASLEFFNRGLASKIETVYLLSPPHLKFISSSRIRELLGFGADIIPYVPKVVAKELMKK